MNKRVLISVVAVLFACVGILAQSRKSVSILGDSYSTFEGFMTPAGNNSWYMAVEPDSTRTDVASVTQTWWHKFITENGYKLEYNNSYGGSTISNTGYNGHDYTGRSFTTRMKQLGRPDIILIMGATNDSWAGSPIGEYKYSDWTKDDLWSFRPAMAYMLKTMKEYYPGTDIYFILNYGLSDEIDGSVAEICSHYGIPLIELDKIDCRKDHPTVKGMAQIAETVAKAIPHN